MSPAELSEALQAGTEQAERQVARRPHLYTSEEAHGVEQQDNKLLFFVMGWVLGLASHVIIEEYRRWRERRDLKVALRSELHELQYRLALVRWQVSLRLGLVDRALFEWLRPIVSGYTGIYAESKLVALVQTMAEVPANEFDTQIKVVAEMGKAPPDRAVLLKKNAASSGYRP